MTENKTKIGKDVIESLTLAMYDDPKFIYREYIQNSADQIDIALEEGLIEKRDDCKIDIIINKTNRIITIIDNATGIPKEKVLPILKNIARGIKDRTKHKGFRGIGRLGGLAYCDRLIFETSYYGEKIKSKLIWNAKELKQIINNRSKKEDASDVIDTITSLMTEPEENDKRYFKVILENITNNILLDKDAIYDYLAMVAPVPYKKGFWYQDKIYKKAKEYNYTIDEYNIFINNDQIFKEYTISIYEGEKHNKRKIDEIFDIDFFDIRDKNDRLISWGWYSISKFLKQIPPVNIARGIRLRKGNIQIGDERQLVKLFKEARGSFYFFGEVHVVSPKLIPNARRDYFIENDTMKLFENKLKEKFKELHDLYHFSSQTRSEKKKIERFANFTDKFKKKTEIGFTKPEEKEEYEEKYKKIKEEAKKAKEKIEKIKSKVSNDKIRTKLVKKIIEDIDKNIKEKEDIIVAKTDTKPRLLTDNLSKYSRKERKLVSKILSIIDDILPKELSDVVKQKIIEELNKQGKK